MNISDSLAIQSPFALPNYDSLTGFLNRETMIGELFRETDRIQRMGGVLCFMLIEIEGFSEIRSEYGSENADRLLRYIAGRLRRYLRTYDLIARQEENEFLIALPGCIPADALLLGEPHPDGALSSPGRSGCEIHRVGRELRHCAEQRALAADRSA